MLYAFNPSSIFYSVIATPEHFSIACFALATWMVWRMWEGRESPLRLLAGAVIVGLVSGVGDAVKPFFPIFLTAFTVAAFAHGLSRKERPSRLALKIVTVAVVTVCVRGVVVEGFARASEKMFGVAVSRESVVPVFVGTGVNRTGEGQIHLGTTISTRMYREDLMHGVSHHDAAKRLWSGILRDWQGHLQEIPGLVMKKTIWAWQDDNIPLYYHHRKGNGRTGGSLRSLAQAYYLFLMGLATLGCLAAWKYRDDVGDADVSLMSALLVVGFFCLLLIGEAQSRYKCAIVPYVTLLSSMGSREICRLMVRCPWWQWKDSRAMRMVETS